MKISHWLLASAGILAALWFGLSSESPRGTVTVLAAEPTRQALAKPEPAPRQETLATTNQITEEAKKSIGAQIREAEYWLTARMADDQAGDGIAAPNRGQRMNVHFDRQGLTLIPWPQAGEADWSFQVAAATAAAPTAEKTRARYGEGEWFENSARGVEHGMTLDQPASDPDEPLVFAFRVNTELQAQAGNNNQILFKDAAGHTQLSPCSPIAGSAPSNIVASRRSQNGRPTSRAGTAAAAARWGTSAASA